LLAFQAAVSFTSRPQKAHFSILPLILIVPYLMQQHKRMCLVPYLPRDRTRASARAYAFTAREHQFRLLSSFMQRAPQFEAAIEPPN
jgi:hypothetical protein